jgi:hypothetical protein
MNRIIYPAKFGTARFSITFLITTMILINLNIRYISTYSSLEFQTCNILVLPCGWWMKYKNNTEWFEEYPNSVKVVTCFLWIQCWIQSMYNNASNIINVHCPSNVHNCNICVMILQTVETVKLLHVCVSHLIMSDLIIDTEVNQEWKSFKYWCGIIKTIF